MFLRTALLVSVVAHGAIILSPSSEPQESKRPLGGGGLKISVVPRNTFQLNQPQLPAGKVVPIPSPVVEVKPLVEPSVRNIEASIASLAEEQSVIIPLQNSPLQPALPKLNKPQADPKLAQYQKPLKAKKRPAEKKVAVLKKKRVAKKPAPSKKTRVVEEMPATQAAPLKPNHPVVDSTVVVVMASVQEKEQAKLEGMDSIEQSYKKELLNLIEANKKYPLRSRRRGDEGVVLVSFVIQRDGVIDLVTVSAPSDHKRLDRAATQLMERIGQFKPIPSQLSREQWAFQVPIRYSLH